MPIEFIETDYVDSGQFTGDPPFRELSDPTLLEENVLRTIDIVRYIAEKEFEPSRKVEQCGLTYGLAIAALLRGPLQYPFLLEASGLLDKTGGPNENPFRRIDGIGLLVLARVMEIYKLNARVYCEEYSDWVDFGTGDDWIVFPDNVDETSQIGRGNPVQTTAISMYTKDGILRFGLIASLVNRQVILYSGGETHLYIFDETTNRFNTVSPLPVAAREKHPITLATLRSRLPCAANTVLVREAGLNAITLQTFGGHAVMALLQGQIDIAFDPEGQPYNEAANWAGIAQYSGCTVIITDQNRNDIDLGSELLRASYTRSPLNTRYPVAIGRPGIPRDMLEKSLQII